MRLGIGHVRRLRAWFVGGISNAGMHASFGTVQPAGERWERCRTGVKELEGRRKGVCFPFVSIGEWKRKGGPTWKRLAHGRIGGFCDDIYSYLCFR